MKTGLTTIAMRLLLAGALFASNAIAADFQARLERDSAGNLVLRWASESGKHYVLETSPDLITWTALEDGPVGTGADLTRTVLAAGTDGAARTFWRVSTLASGPIIPVGLFDPNLITTWNPGILADSQLGLALTERKLPTRTTIFRTLQPGDDLNAAIQACPEGSVIQLAPGRFTSPTTVMLNRGIVLRGSGSQGADAGGTTIACAESWPDNDTVVQIGYTPAGYTADSACYDYGSFAKGSFLLAADAVKGSTTIKIGANAAQFKAGDFALIDQRDDAEITAAAMFKREDSVAGRQVLRSISQRVEIASVAGDTVTVASPLHWTFSTAKSAGLARSPRAS
ncbi:MAG: hypothetical protein IPL39_11275 [Opitutaceae bacterium]|nr:hypothetical protein [Opitutaceae bacterium]